MYLFKHIKISFLQTEAEPASETSCFVKIRRWTKPPPKKRKNKDQQCMCDVTYRRFLAAIVAV